MRGELDQRRGFRTQAAAVVLSPCLTLLDL